MKKHVIFLLLVVLITPSITYSAWWNPFTWKIFQKKETVSQVQVVNTETIVSTSTEKEKSPDQKIIELQKQIDDLKKSNEDAQPVNIPVSTIKNTEKKTVTVTDACKNIEGTQSIVPSGMYLSGSDCLIIKTDVNQKIEQKEPESKPFVDWVKLENEGVTKFKDLLTSNEAYFNRNNGIISEIDGLSGTVMSSIAAKGYLDSTGIKLGQDYLAVAQEAKLSHQEANMSSREMSTTLNQLIMAIYARDGVLVDKLFTQYMSQSSESDILIKKNVLLYAKQANAFILWGNYANQIN